MDGRPTWTDCDEAGDYVVPNVLSPRDLVFRPDNMDETVPHILLQGQVENSLCILMELPVYEISNLQYLTFGQTIERRTLVINEWCELRQEEINLLFAYYAKTNAQISCTSQLISTYVFTT